MEINHAKQRIEQSLKMLINTGYVPVGDLRAVVHAIRSEEDKPVESNGD